MATTIDSFVIPYLVGVVQVGLLLHHNVRASSFWIEFKMHRIGDTLPLCDLWPVTCDL